MHRSNLLELAWPPATCIALVGLVTLVGLQFGTLEDTVVGMLINLVLVVGLWTFVGNSGVVSFGHIAFMAVGAYLAALLTIPATTREFLLPNLPGVLQSASPGSAEALIIAVAAAALFGLVVGIPLMRLSGVAAGIATLSLLVIVTTVLEGWKALTGGSGTLTGVPVTTTSGLAFATAAAAILVAYLFSLSISARRLRATREDLVAARALGIRVVRERLIAFVLSAAVMAVGGWLYAHNLGSISVDAFSFRTTFVILAMLVVGGTHSLFGAVVGTIAVTALTEIVSRLEDADVIGTGWATVVLAAAVIAVLVLRPRGITNGEEPRLPVGLRLRRSAEPDRGAVPDASG